MGGTSVSRLRKVDECLMNVIHESNFWVDECLMNVIHESNFWVDECLKLVLLVLLIFAKLVKKIQAGVTKQKERSMVALIASNVHLSLLVPLVHQTVGRIERRWIEFFLIKGA